MDEGAPVEEELVVGVAGGMVMEILERVREAVSVEGVVGGSLALGVSWPLLPEPDIPWKYLRADCRPGLSSALLEVPLKLVVPAR